VARSWARHARLDDPADPVALEQESQAGDMILVRMADDDDIHPAVPWRQPFVERHDQAVRIRAGIEQHARAPPALDQDGVALADVEHDHRGRAVRTMMDDEGDSPDRHHEGDRGDPRGPDRERSPPDPSRWVGRGPICRTTRVGRRSRQRTSRLGDSWPSGPAAGAREGSQAPANGRRKPRSPADGEDRQGGSSTGDE
jgi:hypothetical protein